MSDNPNNQITSLLRAASAGEKNAAEALLPLVYDELRILAKARLSHTPPGNTLQATALVHEAYLKLVANVPGGDPNWDSRGHFFGAAARAMRDILVDQARRKLAVKHGGDRQRVDLDAESHSAPSSIAPPARDMLALDAAITELEALDPRKAQVVMLKYFAGLSHEQIAAATGASLPTINRDWRFARAWLRDRIESALTDEPPPADAQEDQP
jgi:RNA polymerase sigma factor (TIGR02999 family)